MKKVTFPFKFTIQDREFIMDKVSTRNVWYLSKKFQKALLESQVEVASKRLPDEIDLIDICFELASLVEEVFGEGSDQKRLPIDIEENFPYPSKVPFEIASKVAEALNLFDFLSDLDLEYQIISNEIIPNSIVDKLKT